MLSGLPAGSNGNTPALEGAFRTLKATVDGGFAKQVIHQTGCRVVVE